MITRILSSVFGAILTAVVAWLVCRPLAPVVKVDYSKISAPVSNAEVTPVVKAIFGAHGPTLYSIVLCLVFGFLFCGLCSFLYVNERALLARVLKSFVAGVLGGMAFCLVTALFDLSSAAILEGQISPVGLTRNASEYACRISSWLFWWLQSFVLSVPVLLSIGIKKDRWLKLASTAIGAAVITSGVLFAAHQISEFFLLGSTLYQTLHMASLYQQHKPFKLPDTDYYAYQQMFYLVTMIALSGSLGILFAIVCGENKRGWLVQKNGNQILRIWPIFDQVMQIGSDPKCRICCNPVPGFAAHHAQVHRFGSSFTIKVMGSTAFMLVNGARQSKAHLRDGDKIRLGDHTFEFTTSNPIGMPAPSANMQEVSQRTPSLTPLQQASIAFLVDCFGNRHALNRDCFTVGRETDCDLCLSWEPSVSSYHADIVRGPDAYRIVDKQSSNGTKVNGQPVSSPVPLGEGDIIELGAAKLTFEYAKDPNPALIPIC